MTPRPLDEIEEEIAGVWREYMRPLYEERDARLVIDAESGTYQVPKRRHQTDKQRAISRCPRCRGHLEAS